LAYWLAVYVNNGASIAPGTDISGAIKMKTPPFKYVNPTSVPPIRAYVYWRSHLVDIYEYP